jgi:phage baseplate assembly protein W
MANYSDIKQDFSKTSLGDIELVTDIDSIRQALKNVVLTRRRSRTKYQNPIYGTNINNLMFEKITPITEELIRNEIETGIKNFEPRVEILEVSVETGDNSIDITLFYRILALQRLDSVTFNIDIIK